MPMHKEEWEGRSRTVFSGSYCLNQSDFPIDPKARKCQDGYSALTNPSGLSISSAEPSHALVKFPAATRISADPVCRNSWLGEYSYFYLLLLCTYIALQMLVVFFPGDCNS